jgi:hypothetical protein
LSYRIVGKTHPMSLNWQYVLYFTMVY